MSTRSSSLKLCSDPIILPISNRSGAKGERWEHWMGKERDCVSQWRWKENDWSDGFQAAQRCVLSSCRSETRKYLLSTTWVSESLQSGKVSAESVVRVYYGSALKAHEKTNCLTGIIKVSTISPMCKFCGKCAGGSVRCEGTGYEGNGSFIQETADVRNSHKCEGIDWGCSDLKKKFRFWSSNNAFFSSRDVATHGHWQSSSKPFQERTPTKWWCWGRMVSSPSLVYLWNSIAGAIPFCQTNIPTTCISYTCANSVYGKCAYDLEISVSSFHTLSLKLECWENVQNTRLHEHHTKDSSPIQEPQRILIPLLALAAVLREEKERWSLLEALSSDWAVIWEDRFECLPHSRAAAGSRYNTFQLTYGRDLNGNTFKWFGCTYRSARKSVHLQPSASRCSTLQLPEPIAMRPMLMVTEGPLARDPHAIVQVMRWSKLSLFF